MIRKGNARKKLNPRAGVVVTPPRGGVLSFSSSSLSLSLFPSRERCCLRLCVCLVDICKRVLFEYYRARAILNAIFFFFFFLIFSNLTTFKTLNIKTLNEREKREVKMAPSKSFDFSLFQSRNTALLSLTLLLFARVLSFWVVIARGRRRRRRRRRRRGRRA